MIAANSSPIILLGKQGKLDLLKKCFNKVIIPRSVYEEINYNSYSTEAIQLRKAIKNKWLIVEKIEVSSSLYTENLGQGEKEAISLAEKHKIMLLIDDDSAKAYALILGVEAHGTFYVLYLACVKKLISKDEALTILKNMIEHGFFISIELYTEFVDLLKSIK